MVRLNRRGQNTLEYVLLVTAVVAAFLGIQHYLNRGVQGRMKSASDNIGKQFDAYATTNSYTTTKLSTVNDVVTTAGLITSAIIGVESTDRDGDQTVQAAP